MKEENNCGFHHWGTYSESNEYRIEPGGEMSYVTKGGGFDIFNKVKQKCQHEGCEAEREEWVKINSISGNEDITRAFQLIEELCNV